MNNRPHGFVSQTSNACRCGLMLPDCLVAREGAYLPVDNERAFSAALDVLAAAPPRRRRWWRR